MLWMPATVLLIVAAMMPVRVVYSLAIGDRGDCWPSVLTLLVCGPSGLLLGAL